MRTKKSARSTTSDGLKEFVVTVTTTTCFRIRARNSATACTVAMDQVQEALEHDPANPISAETLFSAGIDPASPTPDDGSEYEYPGNVMVPVPLSDGYVVELLHDVGRQRGIEA
jgi:hypothetical protein